MKKIEISGLPGEMRLTLDHLTFLQDSFIEVINQLFQSTAFNAGSPYVLYGVSVASPSSNASCTAGAIYYNGEIYLVDAHSITGTGTLRWKIDTTYSPATSKWRNPVRTEQTYAIHKLKMTYTSGGSEFVNASLNRYVNPLTAVDARVTTLETFSTNTTPVMGSGITNNSLTFKKSYHTIEISGRISCSAPVGASSVLFTIPAGYAPPTQDVIAQAFNGLTGTFIPLLFSTESGSSYVINEVAIGGAASIWIHLTYIR